MTCVCSMWKPGCAVFSMEDMSGRRKLIASFLKFAAGLSLLLSVFAARGDTVFVGNWGSNSIVAFGPSGAPSVFTTTGVNGPGGMTFDAQGNLYLANDVGNTVYKYDPFG